METEIKQTSREFYPKEDCAKCAPHKALFAPSPDLHSLLLLVHEFATTNNVCKDRAKLTIYCSESPTHQKLYVTVTNRCQRDGAYLFTFDEVIDCVYGQRGLEIALHDSSAFSAFHSWIQALRSITGLGEVEINFLYRQVASSSWDERGHYLPQPTPGYRATQLVLGLDSDDTAPSWTMVKDVDCFDEDED